MLLLFIGWRLECWNLLDGLFLFLALQWRKNKTSILQMTPTFLSPRRRSVWSTRGEIFVFAPLVLDFNGNPLLKLTQQLTSLWGVDIGFDKIKFIIFFLKESDLEIGLLYWIPLVGVCSGKRDHTCTNNHTLRQQSSYVCGVLRVRPSSWAGATEGEPSHISHLTP